MRQRGLGPEVFLEEILTLAVNYVALGDFFTFIGYDCKEDSEM